MTIRLIKGLCCALLTALVSTSAFSAEYVVKIDALTAALSNTEIQSKLTKYLGSPATVLRKVGAQDDNLFLVRVEDAVLRTRGLNYVASSLLSVPGVFDVESNINFKQSQTIPADPLYNSSQADYLGSSKAGAIQQDKAWGVTRGSAAVVVGVLDTGLLFKHPDIKLKAVPGYSFYRNSALDKGIGPGPNASDPGDNLTDFERRSSSQCVGYEVTPSDWHGTRVASVIAATSSNGIGMAGVSQNARILPVRVVGPCGADLSDILDGMAWAAGFSMNNDTPVNPNPAKILNLSFNASETTCPTSLQNMVNRLIAANIAVVASAGNNNGVLTAPASCKGVVSVGASTNEGLKSGFSNYGEGTTIFAPGGNQASSQGITTAYDASVDKPSGNYIYGPKTGTSFSAPIVAGVLANMFAVNPNLTVANAVSILKSTASSFPNTLNVCPAASVNAKSTADCGCTKSTCGSGIVNALAAVNAARQKLAVANISSSTEVTGSNTVQMDGTLSTAGVGNSLAGYKWAVVSGTAALQGSDSAKVTVSASPSNNPISLRLTITDSSGQKATADANLLFTVSSTAPNTPVTQPSGTPSTGTGSSGGGGGGGSIPWAMLAILGAIGAAMRIRALKA